jgi:predicted enzyme related to lactoylglutathione lyase
MEARVTAAGEKLLGRSDADPSGRFAWILDPNGIKLELWEPKE